MLLPFDKPTQRTVLRNRLVSAMEKRRSAGKECAAGPFLEAIEAVGYWVKWGLPRRTLAAYWPDAGQQEIASQAITAADEVCKAVNALALEAEGWWGGVEPFRGSRRAVERVSAADLLKERMRAAAVCEGLESVCELASQQANGQGQSSGHYEIPGELSTAQDRLSKTIHDFDRALQRYRWEICDVAETRLLSIMRAPLRPRALLPWWLNGTLELMSLAAKTPAGRRLRESWKSRGSAMLRTEYSYYLEQMTQEFVSALHGKGLPVDRSAPSREEGGQFVRKYDWRYDSDASPTRIRLVAPVGDTGRSKLKLRLVESESDELLTPSYRLSRQRSVTLGVGEELLGKMMFLNGLMFRWCDMGDNRPPQAHLSERSPSRLPGSGQLILVDCQTRNVLKPVIRR
jgi:hypothetical protein